MPDVKGSYNASETENTTKVRTLPPMSTPQNGAVPPVSTKNKSVLKKFAENSKFSKLSTEKKMFIFVIALALLCALLVGMLLKTNGIFNFGSNDPCEDSCTVEREEKEEKGLTYTENPGCDVLRAYKSETLSYINNGYKGETFPIYIFSCKYPKGDFIPADLEDREFVYEDIVDRGELDDFGNYTGHHEEGLSGTSFYIFGAFDNDGTCRGIVIIEDELYKGTGLYPKISTKTVTDMCGCDYIGTVNKYFIENYQWNVPAAEVVSEAEETEETV